MNVHLMSKVYYYHYYQYYKSNQSAIYNDVYCDSGRNIMK